MNKHHILKVKIFPTVLVRVTITSCYTANALKILKSVYVLFKIITRYRLTNYDTLVVNKLPEFSGVY